VKKDLEHLENFARSYANVRDCLDGGYELASRSSAARDQVHRVEFNATGTSVNCTCGRTGTTEKYLCAHIIAVAQHLKKNYKLCLSEKFLTTGWKLQYAEVSGISEQIIRSIYDDVCQCLGTGDFQCLGTGYFLFAHESSLLVTLT
jgi:hypothetical protein